MYGLLLLRLGYTFGRDDHIEVIPYALLLNDASLFPHDLFLQGIAAILPNERLVVSSIFALFGAQMEPMTLVIHALVSLVLLLGMERVARQLVGNKYLAWAAVFLSLIPFYYWNPGGNELYYNLLGAASFAKAIGIWAIFYFLKRRFRTSILLIATATFFHPIVGIQLAILLFGVMACEVIFGHGISEDEPFLKMSLRIRGIKEIFACLLRFLPTGFLYVLLIKMAYGDASTPISSETFFDIIFDFRNKHHFLPSNYPLKSFFLAGICWIAAFGVFRKNALLKWMLLIMLTGYLLYPIATEVLRSPTLVPFQWFKTTVWLKFLGMIAFMNLLHYYGPSWSQVKEIRWEKWGLTGAIALTFSVLLFFPHKLPWQLETDFGQQHQTDKLVQICEQVQTLTPVDATFIYPYEVSELQSYARRSGWVDYKANLKQPAGAAIWMERISQVYGFDYKHPPDDYAKAAKTYFLSLNTSAMQTFAQQGVTHILTYPSHDLAGLKEVVRNAEWVVYEITF